MASEPTTQTPRRWLRASLLVAAIVAALALGGLVATVAGSDDAPVPVAATTNEAPRGLPVANAPGSAGTTAAPAAAIADLPGLVDRARPSVVAINTVSAGTRNGRQAQGLGTGIVVDKDGHILTNYHVVEGADQVTVEFADGTLARGRVVGSDPGNDLAVVRVSLPSSALQPVRFADSDQVRLGEPVFAIGNPFSLKFSVTSGIVSGLERESQGGISGRAIRGVLQTDAAVNPGNSGGPLFNAAGELIGINAAIENPTGQRVWVGVGFAVPSNTAQRFLPEMIAGRRVTHPQLGVSGETLNEINARDAGVEVQRGVYITSVQAGSAADRAGLRAAAISDSGGALLAGGDVVVSVNGREVTTIQQLARAIDGFKVGDQVKLAVVRGGKQIEITATLLEWNG
jgi:putative serine protease PepD